MSRVLCYLLFFISELVFLWNCCIFLHFSWNSPTSVRKIVKIFFSLSFIEEVVKDFPTCKFILYTFLLRQSPSLKFQSFFLQKVRTQRASLELPKYKIGNPDNVEKLAFTTYYSPPISFLLPLYHPPLSSPQIKETLRKEKKENECFRGKVGVVPRRFRLEEEEKDSSSCRKYPKAAAAAGKEMDAGAQQGLLLLLQSSSFTAGGGGGGPPSIPLQCLGIRRDEDERSFSFLRTSASDIGSSSIEYPPVSVRSIPYRTVKCTVHVPHMSKKMPGKLLRTRNGKQD